MSWMNRKIYLLVTATLLGVLLVIAFAASSHAASARASGGGSDDAFANLRHTPFGTATLTWDPQSENLTVTISLVGLAGNSTHPDHIHVGDCDDNGPILYPLNNLVANAAGDAQATTVIPEVEGGIPASGWYVNVHNGPTLATPDEAIPIACGNVHNANNAQTVKTFLGAAPSPNQAVSGSSILTLKNETLTVIVTVSGLVPGSVHPEHIHAGSCQSQSPGTIVYPLNNLVADTNGDATSTTVINDVETIPQNAWYVNVHRSTDLTTQTGFDPIACGNVKN
jgi:CHRD domain-containing protein